MLKNKNILFIAPVFYNYHRSIISELEQQGANVKFFPERRYSTVYKIINNFRHAYLDKYQKKYYEEIYKKIEQNSFDILFVIRGYKISTSFLEKIKRKNPNIKRIMYQWDSERSNPYSDKIQHFDRILSFDIEDANSLRHVEYLPLFYTNEFNIDSRADLKYDLCFIAGYLPERYEFACNLNDYCIKHDLTLNLYLYINFSFFVKEFLKRKMKYKSFLYFNPLTRNKYIDILKDSKVVIDFSSINQSGLSIRVIEAIGANKGILTSNTNLKKEINSSKIECFSKDCFSFTKNTIKLIQKGDYLSVNYSLENWIKEIFKDYEN